MNDILKRFAAGIKSIFGKKKKEDPREVPVYLDCNETYIRRIDHLERLIEQVKIDYAMGWITKDALESHFNDFRKELTKLSEDYSKELKLYSA